MQGQSAATDSELMQARPKGVLVNAFDRFSRLASRLLTTFLAGSALGVGLLVTELLRNARIGIETVAFYSLTLGVGVALFRTLAGLVLPLRLAHLLTWALIGAFASVSVLFWVNVSWLAGVPFLAVKSLIADVVVAASSAALFMFFGSRTTSSARWKSVESRRAISLSAVAVIVACVSTLGLRWPAEHAFAQRTGTGPNLFLLVMDSVRTDHMSAYGYRRNTSPSIASLRNARYFDEALSAASWTVPSVEQLLKPSRGPVAHKNLVEELHEQGYTTAVFSDNPHLERHLPAIDRFDHVAQSTGEWRKLLHGSLAEDVLDRIAPGSDAELVEAALEWAKQQQGPVFVYVHLMDSHTPYPAEPFDGIDRPGRDIQFPAASLNMTPAETEEVIARYDAGVRKADAAVGTFLNQVSSWTRPYMAVITADHGESLGEGGRWFHGKELSFERVAVPLVLVGAGVEPGRLSDPVGHSTVGASLLAAAGNSLAVNTPFDLRTGRGDGRATGYVPPNYAYRVENGRFVLQDFQSGSTSITVINPEKARLAPPTDDFSDPLPEINEISPADRKARLRALGYAD